MVLEERRSAPGATTRMKLLAGSLPLDPAAEAILAGIDRGEFLIIPSRRAKMAALLPRVLPAAAPARDRGPGDQTRTATSLTVSPLVGGHAQRDPPVQ